MEGNSAATPEERSLLAESLRRSRLAVVSVHVDQTTATLDLRTADGRVFVVWTGDVDVAGGLRALAGGGARSPRPARAPPLHVRALVLAHACSPDAIRSQFSGDGYARASWHPDLRALLDEIERVGLDRAPGAAEAARIAGLPVRTFQRRWAGAAGRPYEETIAGARISLIQILADVHHLPLKTAACAAGYADVSAASHAAVRLTGRTLKGRVARPRRRRRHAG